VAEVSTLPAKREIRVVESNSVALFDTAKFEHMQRIANVMALASLIPDHLKSKAQMREQAFNETLSNCFMLVNQAHRWNVDPFSIAPETYALRGKLGYQGKLVAAIVNTRAGLKRNLDFEYSGEGDEREITVIGEFLNEDKPRTIKLKVKDAKTDNQMWQKDPDQKLVYSGATKWARRYCPEVLLGVLTDDDLERMAAERAIDVTPAPRPKREDFAAHAKIEEVAEEKPEVVVAEMVETEARMVEEAEAVAAEPEPDLPEEEALSVRTIDDEALFYDDPADFAAGYIEEMKRAHKQAGIKGLNGFAETNAASLERFAAINPTGAKALRKTHADLAVSDTKPNSGDRFV